jgi:dTDP-4-amino-4,6-dideoxygalactose transaminase
LLDELKERGIHAIFHYVPLHGSPAGRKYGRCHGDLPETEAAAERIVRLPLWIEMGEPEIVRVVEATGDILAARARS